MEPSIRPNPDAHVWSSAWAALLHLIGAKRRVIFLQQADGIQEGYAAFYKDSGAEGVAVYALTYADGQPATVPPSTYPEIARYLGQGSGAL